MAKPRHDVIQPEDTSIRLIALTRGMNVVVDACEYGDLIRKLWVAGKFGNKWYAFRTIRIDGKKTALLMHRYILGLKPGDGILADHENGNGLDCRRDNLRRGSDADNSRNRVAYIGKASRFKGVRPYSYTDGMWEARITVGGVVIHLGIHLTEEAAARAYDAAAIEHFGRFAWLNFPEEHPISSHGPADASPLPPTPPTGSSQSPLA